MAVVPPPHLSDVELAEGTSSELAVALHDAISRNADRPQAREALTRLNGRVLFRAEDRGDAVTLDFAAGHARVADGEEDGARVRIVGDHDALLALTQVPFSGRVPGVWTAPGRNALKRQLGGELTIRGAVRRSPTVLRLLRVLAA